MNQYNRVDKTKSARIKINQNEYQSAKIIVSIEHHSAPKQVANQIECGIPTDHPCLLLVYEAYSK